MRLNNDCIRDILLTVEDKCDFNRNMQYYIENNNHEKLKNYSHEEIIYHIRQCELSGLILGVSYADGGDFVRISDLSPDGHKFLTNIREDNIWNKTKSIAKKIGCSSLPSMIEISTRIISEIIKNTAI